MNSDPPLDTSGGKGRLTGVMTNTVEEPGHGSKATGLAPTKFSSDAGEVTSRLTADHVDSPAPPQYFAISRQVLH